ncbi:MAG: hypothetical protein KatS3mg090_0723 [Patescibacteria group bacterium]|nr:MAG: hypothetical protein KatS3mg090_0723 [Patescibacteria group bacterium]
MEVTGIIKLIFISLTIGLLTAVIEVVREVYKDEKKLRSIKKFVARIVFFKDGIRIYSSSSSSESDEKARVEDSSSLSS